VLFVLTAILMLAGAATLFASELPAFLDKPRDL